MLGKDTYAESDPHQDEHSPTKFLAPLLEPLTDALPEFESHD